METVLVISAIMITLGIFYICYVPSANSPVTALWEELPTKEAYINAHPRDINADGRVTCHHCHCAETLDIGLARFTDFRRTIICGKCKTQLWREEEK